MELKDKRYNDIRLIFNEAEHSYADTLNNSYISTTQILHQYQPKFDKNYWLRKKSKELGISEKKLEEQWSTITKEACERGTNTHNGLEDVPTVIGYMKQINDLANQFPNTIKALNIAEENLLYEQENTVCRGGTEVISSMIEE